MLLVTAGDLHKYERTHLLVDVRSPLEFQQGHIPGAVNIPLLDDNARAIVGTIYARCGKEVAITEALRLVGPTLSQLLEQCKCIAQGQPLIVYCARGGMRSNSMSWLFSLTGIPVLRLAGGYKIYRRWVLEQFEKKYDFAVLSGYTGSGKTTFLKESGKQFLDLEGIACHRGSVFGGFDQRQPTQQQFENFVGRFLASTSGRIWVESESQKIGSLVMPRELMLQLNNAARFVISKSKNERVATILRDYVHLSNITAISIIHKGLARHLGGARTQEVVRLLEDNRREEAVGVLLEYYDGIYSRTSIKNQTIACLIDENDFLKV